jgi:hypothetical protein
MGGAAAISLLLCLSQVIPTAGVRSELGAGQSPTIPGEPPKGTVLAVIEPLLRLRLGRAMTYGTVAYRPRVMWRQPNATDTDRPLLLHQVDLSLAVRPSAPLIFRGGARVSVGEPDYTALQSIFGRSQGQLPLVQKLVSVTSELDVGYSLSERFVLGGRGSFTLRRPYGGDQLPVPTEVPAGTAPPPPLLGKQQGVAVGPYFVYELTKRDNLQMLSEGELEKRDPGLRFWVAFLSAGWEHRVRPSQSITVHAGVSRARIHGDAQGAEPAYDMDTTSPIASVGYAARMKKSDGSELAISGALGVVNEIDPVLSRAGPRATMLFNLEYRLSPVWQLASAASFGTTVRDPVMAMMPTNVNGKPDETMASANLLVRYRPTPYLAVDAGGRWSDRGPNLRVDDFKFHQRELMFIVAATLVSGRQDGR